MAIPNYSSMEEERLKKEIIMLRKKVAELEQKLKEAQGKVINMWGEA